MPKFNGVSEVKDNDTYEQLVKQGSFTGSDGVVYTYDQTGRLYITDDHVEEELRGYITDLQNKVNSLESGSSNMSENKLDKNLGAENSGKLLNVGSDGNISFIDNNYITSSVNNLDNYYLKTETYTREEINNQINTIRTGLFKPVDVLPDVGEEGYIYLVSNSSSQGDISTQAETENVRDEYIWIADNNKYEYIGSTSVNLTNYYNKTETNSLLDYKVNTADIKTLSFAVAADDYYVTSDDGKVVATGGSVTETWNPLTQTNIIHDNFLRPSSMTQFIEALNSLVDRVAALEEQITAL